MPDAPIGWPKAIAPPFTFTFSSWIPRVFKTAILCAANASLTSKRSRSLTFHPANSKAFFEAGKDLNVRAGCPNLIERIESGLLSYGNDFDNNDNPFECGFEKYVNLDSDIIFLGKENLKKIKSNGIKRKLMGVQIETNNISLTGSIDIMSVDGNLIGELRSACYSPHFKKVIGIAMINEPFCKISSTGKVEIGGKNIALKVCELPFI